MREAALRDAALDLTEHRSLGLDLVRIYLGIALFVRGAIFVAQDEMLMRMIRSSGDWFWAAAVGHYVAGVHLVGGIMLVVGAYTRLAAVAQIPVLLGAVFFTHWGEGLLSRGQGLELAGLVLFLLIVFAVFGAGPLSIDARLRAQGARESTRTARPLGGVVEHPAP